MLALPPLSLYVHIPWCVRKCPYCDFNSHEYSGELPEAKYIDALIDDLTADLDQLPSRSLQSIFIGGGTPSLFSATSLQRLLQRIAALIEFSPTIEITLEANPGTAEAKRFAAYREAGINRLSIGVQSFSNLQLQKLGRIHDTTQATAAISMARSAGFDNFNIDLMHGLSGQTSAEAMVDLQQAIALEPTHLSWYQLTIEPNTVFYNRPPPLPADDELDSIQQSGLAMLAEAGFAQYEVSAFAQPGKKSLHNVNYWQFGDYIGIGAGAHGKLTDPSQDSIVRTRKSRQPAHYLQSSVQRQAPRQTLAREGRALEFVLNALRLREGFSESLFSARTGLAFSSIAKQVEYLTTKGLMQSTGGVVTTTDRGYQMLNSVLEEFLS